MNDTDGAKQNNAMDRIWESWAKLPNLAQSEKFMDFFLLELMNQYQANKKINEKTFNFFSHDGCAHFSIEYGPNYIKGVIQGPGPYRDLPLYIGDDRANDVGTMIQAKLDGDDAAFERAYEDYLWNEQDREKVAQREVWKQYAECDDLSENEQFMAFFRAALDSARAIIISQSYTPWKGIEFYSLTWGYAYFIIFYLDSQVVATIHGPGPYRNIKLELRGNQADEIIATVQKIMEVQS